MKRDYLKHLGFTQTEITMSNTPQLPAELEAEIREKGKEYAKSFGRREFGYYALNWEAGATAYAVKLQEAQQEIERLNEQNQKQQDKNKKLSGHYTAIKAKADNAVDLLEEAKIQLEYLSNKFGETGSGNNVLSRIKTFLDGK